MWEPGWGRAGSEGRLEPNGRCGGVGCSAPRCRDEQGKKEWARGLEGGGGRRRRQKHTLTAEEVETIPKVLHGGK